MMETALAQMAVRIKGGGGEEEDDDDDDDDLLEPLPWDHDDVVVSRPPPPMELPILGDAVHKTTGPADIVSRDPETLDKMLAAELTSLSMSERDQAMLDLHGVADDTEETPDIVQQNLFRMEVCLKDMVMKDTEGLTKSYQEALDQNRAFVEDREWRTRFLRSVRFNPADAAKRLVKHISAKKKIFGPDYLTKQIRIQDLSDDDRACLESGAFQFLPLKDQAGRSVLLNIQALAADHAMTSRVKALFYLLMAASNDIENQRKGIVMVSLNTGRRGSSDAKEAQVKMESLNILRDNMPMRIDAFHMCHDNPDKKASSAVVTVMHASHIRVRTRHHEGSLEKIKLELMSFGIPCTPEIFPVLGEDEFNLSHHKKWCQRRAQWDLKDAEGAKTDGRIDHGSSGSPQPGDIIETPSSRDVILGRSAFCQQHVGNVKYNQEIHAQFPKYDAAERRSDKTAISAGIVKTMQQAGARLLKEIGGDGPYVLMSDEEAREKISTALRDRRKKVIRGRKSASPS